MEKKRVLHLSSITSQNDQGTREFLGALSKNVAWMVS